MRWRRVPALCANYHYNRYIVIVVKLPINRNLRYCCNLRKTVKPEMTNLVVLKGLAMIASRRFYCG